MFCVDKIKCEHLAILSDLKSCQFAPRRVMFILCVCCQIEDSQIISHKIIPVSHHNILTVTNEGSFFCRFFFLFLLVHKSEFLKTLSRIIYQRILMWSRTEWRVYLYVERRIPSLEYLVKYSRTPIRRLRIRIILNKMIDKKDRSHYHRPYHLEPFFINFKF